MQSDFNCLEVLAQAVRAQIPADAFLKRDRGDALFVTNYDGEIESFVQTVRGSLFALTPVPEWLTRFEAVQPYGLFSASLERFRGAPPAENAIRLFVQGVKLLGGGTSEQRIAFDRAVRQAAAAALRTGSGGGIYALALLRDTILKTNPSFQTTKEVHR